MRWRIDGADHEVSILIAVEPGVGRWLWLLSAQGLDMIMRLPQQGQGCCGCFGSRAWRWQLDGIDGNERSLRATRGHERYSWRGFGW